MRLFGWICLLLLLFLTACGKVTQQVNPEKESPSFTLKFSFDDVFLPTSNVAEKRLRHLGVPARQFQYQDPIYVSLKGYKGKKGSHLSWAKLILNQQKTELEKAAWGNSAKTLLFSYTLQSFDSKDIEVKGAAKKTQIKGLLNSKDRKISLEAPKLSYDFDYYLLSFYSSNEQYRFHVVSAERVSDNKVLSLESTTDFDTFKAIQFLNIHRSMMVDAGMYNKLQGILSPELYTSLQYAFPPYVSKSFKVKQPHFYFNDAFSDTLSEIIEVAFVDLTECEAMLLKNPSFTEPQKKQLLKYLRLFLTESE